MENWYIYQESSEHEKKDGVKHNFGNKPGQNLLTGKGEKEKRKYN